MDHTYYCYYYRLCSQYNLSILYFICTLRETKVCDDKSEYMEVYFGVYQQAGLLPTTFSTFDLLSTDTFINGRYSYLAICRTI